MYDARSKTTAPGGNNLIFPLALAGVVIAAFAAAWFLFGAGGGNGSAPDLSAISSAQTPAIAAHMTSRDEQRYIGALSQLDAGAVGDLDARLARSGLSREQEIEAIMTSGAEVLMQNMDALRYVSAQDINTMLDTGIAQLRAAERSNSPLCQGAMLEHLSNQSPREIERWMAQNGLDAELVYSTTMAYQADIMEMLVRAKASPTRHGPLTPRDEAALQGLMMSMMSDPQVMSAMMASNQSQAMANLDVCALGTSVLTRVRALDDGLKGRAWAAMFSMPEFEQAMSQARDFGF